jgi:hypothetical protein
MPIEMVLNELSIQPLAEDIYVARQRISILVQTLVEATSYRVSRTLRTKDGLSTTLLTDEYTIQHWLSDSQVDTDEQRYIRSLITKAPFLVDLPSLYNQFLVREFHYGERVVAGLGVAHLISGLGVSFASGSEWDSAILPIDASWINQNDQIENDLVQVIHASRPEHIIFHREWLSKRVKKDFLDGRDLWNRKEIMFPSLRFAPEVAAQIQNWTANNPWLSPVIERLIRLDDYCNTWEEGGFDAKALGFTLSVESGATLEQYSDERTFVCADGTERVFSLHVKIGGRLRIYIHPDPQNRIIHIGYVGPHLRTVRFH